MHAEHAQINGAVGVEGTYPLEGGDRRHPRGGGKVAQLLLGIGHAHPAADVEYRTLSSGQQGTGDRQFGRIQGVGFLHGKQRALRGNGGQLHILGQVDEHGARTPFGGDGEGFGNDPSQIRRVSHHEGVLGAGEGHAEHVDLLKRIGPDGGAGHLTADGHQRHRIEQRLRQTGYQIGGAGAGGGDADPHLTGSAGITHRRHGGTLLVAAELMGQATVIQGIVDRHDGPARVTKHLSHTLLLESLYQKLRAVHLENPVLWSKKNPRAVRLGGRLFRSVRWWVYPLFRAAKRAPSGEIIITTRTTIMLTKREAMFIVTTGNPVKWERSLPRMAIRTSTVIFIGQALFT